MFEVRPIGRNCGAEIIGYRAQDAAQSGIPAELRAAFLRYKVLVFRDQELSTAQLKAFGQAWGPLAQQVLPERTVPGHPEVQILEHDEQHPPDYYWHADLTWHPTPPLGAILLSRELPSVGGDTLFADMEAAHAGLSDRMKTYLQGLVAIHDRTMPLHRRGVSPLAIYEFQQKFAPSEHPVVRTHPETGRPLLFVNGAYTTKIKGVPMEESRHVLDFLFTLTDVPEYQCRVRWQPGTMTMWDNRAVQHYAVGDYMPERRRMERVVIAGDRPA